jgi:hypothetical protein
MHSNYPGQSDNFKKLLKYNSKEGINCVCFKDEYNNMSTSTNNVNKTISSRISNTLQNNLGGKITFGNLHLGKSPVVNYLGRMAGQSGGSGTAIKNKF